MKDNNNIEELFRSSLENFEADVNPALWDKIEAGISANPVSVPSGAASAGKSIVSGWIAGSAAVVAVVGITAYFLITGQKQEETKIAQTETIVKTDLQTETQAGIQENSFPTIDPPLSSNVVSATKAEAKVENPKSSTPKSNEISVIKSDENISDSQTKTSETVNENIVAKKATETNHQNNPNIQSAVDKNADNAQAQPAEPQPTVNNFPTENTDSQTGNSETNQNTNNTLGVIPNVFTPNGDGLNDLFMVKPVDVKSFTVTIFDRSGKVIHSWNNPFGFWDGLLKNGEQAPQGTYFYSIVAENINGTVTKKQSSITLKR